MFTFELKPKKRGNWRPEIILCVKLNGDQFPHRPFIPAVYITSHRKGVTFTPPEWYSHGVSHSSFDFSGMAKSDDGLHGFYNSPKRGVEDSSKTLVVYLFGRDTAFYLEDKMTIHEEHKLWLPWRPGARPDYSDYIKRFQYMMRWLKLKLECDSGQNDGVKFILERRDYPVTGSKVSRKLNIGGFDED